MPVNFQQVRRVIARGDWYKQGAAVTPFTAGCPWRSCYAFTRKFRPLPVRFHSLVVYLGRNFFDVYFGRRNMRVVAAYYLRRQRRNPRFIVDSRRWWDRHCFTPLRQELRRLEAMDLRQLNDTELLRLFHAFSRRYQACWREAIFLDAFDVTSDEIVQAAQRQAKATLADADLHALTTVASPSWLQRERRDRLRLLDVVRRRPALRRAVSRDSSLDSLRDRFPDFAAALEAHAGVYHWIENDYAIIRRISAAGFLARLRRLLRQPRHAADERRVLAAPTDVPRRQAAIIRRHRLPRPLVETLRSLVTLAEWRDDRKTMNQMANWTLLRFRRELQRRLRLSPREAEQLFGWEVRRIRPLDPGQRRMLRARYAGAFFAGSPDRPDRCLIGRAAKQLHAQIDAAVAAGAQLRGRPAYPGLVRGTVKVVREQGDFGKLRRGDILVAPNTRPEYVPAMLLAGAIITEEGGITSHAAIVSRELKKPCIVGMQGAIGQLRDGDLVEVDAATGEVRKLA